MCPLPARINYANYVYQLVTSTHVLMNGVFSVLFKKCWQFVLCVISESFLIVCLFVLIYTVSQKVLKVHFRRPFSKVIFSTGNTMELVMCLSLLKRPKTVSFCKYKILRPWIPYSAKELLFSSAVFWITQTLYCLQYYLSWKAHNLLLSLLLLWISSRPKIWVRTENESLKEAHTLN